MRWAKVSERKGGKEDRTTDEYGRSTSAQHQRKDSKVENSPITNPFGGTIIGGH
jgi:hypothetical protein